MYDIRRTVMIIVLRIFLLLRILIKNVMFWDLLPKMLAIKTALCYNMNKNTTVALINVYIMT